MNTDNNNGSIKSFTYDDPFWKDDTSKAAITFKNIYGRFPRTLIGPDSKLMVPYTWWNHKDRCTVVRSDLENAEDVSYEERGNYIYNALTGEHTDTFKHYRYYKGVIEVVTDLNAYLKNQYKHPVLHPSGFNWCFTGEIYENGPKSKTYFDSIPVHNPNTRVKIWHYTEKLNRFPTVNHFNPDSETFASGIFTPWFGVILLAGIFGENKNKSEGKRRVSL